MGWPELARRLPLMLVGLKTECLLRAAHGENLDLAGKAATSSARPVQAEGRAAPFAKPTPTSFLSRLIWGAGDR